MSTVLHGTPGAPGIAIAPVWVYEPTAPGIVAGADAEAAAAAGPAAAIRAAAEAAAGQLETLASRVRDAGRAEDAGIFEAQALMATDAMLVDEAVRRAEGGEAASVAVANAAAAAAEILAGLDDELLAARAADVRDVGARLVRILTGASLSLPEGPSIALADDLPPSVTAEIPPGFLLGIALARGSRTAHAVILARSLDIPCVVGAEGLLAAVEAAQEAAPETPLRAAVDGERGEVVLDPDPAEADDFRARGAALDERRARAASLRDRPCATADGERVLLVANIGRPEDAPRALEARAEGVGLFRTEFLFMQRQTPATEREQAEAYRQALEAFGPDRPVVIRLADIGGDKDIPYLRLAPEANPFLGVRAIRLAYASPELLVTQLRAIWRAGAAAGVVPHVMAPMVATMADVELLCSLRDEARSGLLAEGAPVAERMVTGIMVEVPSAAVLAPELARRIDFFSIGTNDLTQYVLAADRGNPALAPLQDALHPAVLRTIAGIVAGADAAGIPVAVCGELAGDPAGALVLVGLGVDELSADAGALDAVRTALAGITRARLDELARAALAAVDAETVRRLATELLPAS
ncbi:MAG TPA: phosphoenolpyruvate--protein phosphotransferase [Candidatus Limnocylindrales bacterium]